MNTKNTLSLRDFLALETEGVALELADKDYNFLRGYYEFPYDDSIKQYYNYRVQSFTVGIYQDEDIGDIEPVPVLYISIVK